MRLTVNGETIQDIRARTIKELLAEMLIQEGRVAVEVNLAVIKRAEYENFILNEGDTVEIVNFVGGG